MFFDCISSLRDWRGAVILLVGDHTIVVADLRVIQHVRQSVDIIWLESVSNEYQQRAKLRRTRSL